MNRLAFDISMTVALGSISVGAGSQWGVAMGVLAAGVALLCITGIGAYVYSRGR